MWWTFHYTNGQLDCKQFNTAEEARRYAHLEGDHLLEYNRTNEDDVESIMALHSSNSVSSGRSK